MVWDIDVADINKKESVRLLSICDTYVRSIYRRDRPFAFRFGVFVHILANSKISYEILKKGKKSNILSYASAHQSLRLCTRDKSFSWLNWASFYFYQLNEYYKMLQKNQDARRENNTTKNSYYGPNSLAF